MWNISFGFYFENTDAGETGQKLILEKSKQVRQRFSSLYPESAHNTSNPHPHPENGEMYREKFV